MRIREHKNRKRIAKKTGLSFAGVTISLFSLGFALFLLVLTVFWTIHISTLGAVLAKLEKDKASLLFENRSLISQVVKLSSLSEMGEKASELGFVKPDKIVYSQEGSVVAKLP